MDRATRNFSCDLDLHLNFWIETGRISVESNDGVGICAARVDCIVTPLKRLNRVIASREHFARGWVGFGFLKGLHSPMPNCITFVVVKAFDPKATEPRTFCGRKVKTEEHNMTACNHIDG